MPMILGFVLLSAGCSTVTNVNYEDDDILTLSCSDLQEVLEYVGDVRVDAKNEQGVTVANAFASVLCFTCVQINQLRASGAKKKAKAAISQLYKAWDDNGCASEEYERNKKLSAKE